MEGLTAVLQTRSFTYMVGNKIENLDVSLGIFQSKPYVVVIRLAKYLPNTKL